MPGATFLRGDQLTLRTIEKADLPFLTETINDPAVRDLLTIRKPITQAQEEQFFEEQVADDETVTLLVCVEDGDPDPAGVIGLEPLRFQDGNTEIGLWLARDYHGNGYGTEAARLVTTYAFQELRMHRVLARVIEGNEASHRIWEKLGFQQEGSHRDEIFTNGEYRDVTYYGVLEDEWDR
jgi:RimJ/RimL family protein N-acetyltransferase